MYVNIFPKPQVEARHRKGMLGANFDCFLKWMQERGYAIESMRYNIQRITNFGKYLEKRGIRSIHQLEGTDGQKLLLDYQRYCKARGHSDRSSSIRLYIRALQDAGVLSSYVSNNPPLLRETQAYRDFLKEYEELSESTIHYRVCCAEKFLRFLDCQEYGSSLPVFGIADVDRFIEQEGARLRRRSQQLLAGAIRSFLRFLYQSGEVSTDLSPLVTSPRCYKLESLPRVLNWDEVKKILLSVDRSTKSGLRDYSILLLLATYGLRAGEVARLKLNNIEWRRETIHIKQSKNGRDLWLPLTPQVGKAILGYLKHARPSSKYREIFLLTCAPWRPLRSVNIGYVMRRYIRLAGIDAPRHGPHLLRHSFATHLIREGVPLKQIGDLLGHKSLESTYIYTKTATEELREVALEVPEVK